MKLNKISYLAAIPALMLGFSSCIEDESVYGTPGEMPSLSVETGVDNGEVPEVNNYFGSETVIDPKINYTGNGELSYEWSIASASRASYEVVSTEPVFRYTFPQGGVFTVILNVTDGTVGFSQDYEVNVNRPFEKGYCLISNDPSGKGNLVFLKDMTPEEIDEGVDPVVVENTLSLVAPDATDESLVGVHLIKPTWPPTAKGRVLVISTTRCYSLDPNSFTLVANLRFGSGFSTTDILPTAAECIALDRNSRRVFTVKSEDNMAVEEAAWQGNAFDDYIINSYEAWGSTNHDITYINKKPLSISNRIFDYNAGGYAFLQNDDFASHEYIAGGPGQEVAMVDEYGPYDAKSNYIITRNPANGDIYWNSFVGFDAYAMDAPELVKSKVVGNASSAIPATDSHFVTSTKHQRSYYYNGNHVYVMIEGTDGINPLPSPSQWALEFPSNEEVTFIGMDKTSVAGAEILIVATVDSATGRGNVYFYDPANVRTDKPGAKPSKTYMNCADRISQVYYKKRV